MSDARRPAGGMGARLRQLASHSFVYGLGGMAARLVGIVLLPVYTHQVTEAEFGQVELILATVTVAAIVLRLGLLTAMFRFSWDRPTDEARRQTIQTVFAAILALSTAGLVAGLVLVEPIAHVLAVDTDLAVIGLLGLWISMNYEVLAGVYRIEQRPTAFVAYSLANVALTAGLSLLFVLPLDLGAEGILGGNFLGSYIVYALLLRARRHTVGVAGFDRELIRRMLHFSLPLMPAGLALWALNVADRFQVQRLGSPDELGIYSAASKIALGIMLPIAAFQTAWVPFANSIRDDDTARDTYRAVFVYWSMVMGFALVAISVLAPPYIHLLMPREWWDAAPVVPLLLAGSFLYGAYMILSFGVNRSKRTRFTPVVTGIAAATNIGLNFVLIPAWGTVGAGVSTVVGYAVLVVLGWANAQANFHVPHDFSRVFRIGAVAAGVVALSVLVVPATGVVGLAARAGLIAAYPAGLAAVGVLTAGEVARFRAMAARIRRPGRRGSRTGPVETKRAIP